MVNPLGFSINIRFKRENISRPMLRVGAWAKVASARVIYKSNNQLPHDENMRLSQSQ